MFRRMRTTQERRANGRRDMLKIDNYQVRLRAKRNWARLPNSWDDDIVDGTRCWKNYRKTQYKVKPINDL